MPGLPAKLNFRLQAGSERTPKFVNLSSSIRYLTQTAQDIRTPSWSVSQSEERLENYFPVVEMKEDCKVPVEPGLATTRDHD